MKAISPTKAKKTPASTTQTVSKTKKNEKPRKRIIQVKADRHFIGLS